MLFMCEAPAPTCGHFSGTSSASAFMSTLVCASCPRLSSAVRQKQKSKNLGMCFPIRLSDEAGSSSHTLLMEQCVWLLL